MNLNISYNKYNITLFSFVYSYSSAETPSLTHTDSHSHCNHIGCTIDSDYSNDSV